MTLGLRGAQGAQPRLGHSRRRATNPVGQTRPSLRRSPQTWSSLPRFRHSPTIQESMFLIRSIRMFFRNWNCTGWPMARISKAEHARILQLVDIDRQKVTDIAAEYGCTPANIYTLLGKLRRAAAATEAAGPDSAATRDNPAPRADLFIVPEPASPQGALLRREATDSPAESAEQDQASSGIESKPDKSTLRECPIQADISSELAQPRTVVVMEGISRRAAAPQRTSGVGAKLAKTGFALAMRAAEGDENVTPFRSLEDLLAAVKPILRSAAQSTDPIWFSIRAIDLSSLDNDAA